MDLNHTPALAPPPGVLPNFIDPESQAVVFTIISTIFLVVMLSTFVMRIYANCWVKHKIRSDDVACILSTGGAVCYTSEIFSITNIIGKHQWDVPVSAVTDRYMQISVIGLGMMYGPIIFCAKLSLYLLYLRIFSPSRRTKYLIYFGITSNILVYLSITVAIGAICIPRQGQSWQKASTSPGCVHNATITGFVYGGFNVVSDLYLFLIPLAVVRQLQLPKKKKLGIYAIFAIGLLACIASIVGLYFRIRYYKVPDQTWHVLSLNILVIIELDLGIICSCVPYLPTLFRSHSFSLLCCALGRLRNRVSKKLDTHSTTAGWDSLDGHPLTQLEGAHVPQRDAIR